MKKITCEEFNKIGRMIDNAHRLKKYINNYKNQPFVHSYLKQREDLCEYDLENGSSQYIREVEEALQKYNDEIQLILTEKYNELIKTLDEKYNIIVE